MKTRRNTAAVPTDAEAKRRLQKLIDRLPLPPGANATVISARVRPYEYSGDYHDEEGHALEYEVGGHTDLDADSALARYRDHDLHRIVSDALGVRRGDEEALLEDTDVLRNARDLRSYPGFSIVWSGTLLDRSTIHTDDGDGRADAIPEVRAGKRNAGFMQKMLADMKTNPRARRVSTAVLGERVRVFRNLHTETWSVESATTGRIIAHPDTVLLEDVRLVSRDAGREKVRRTGKKGVHAVASGTLVAIDGPAPADLARWTPLYYNPFKVDTFVEFVDGKVGKPVRGARMWFAAADHRSQYALAPQEADPGRYKKPKVPKRRNPDEDDFDAEYWDEQLQEMCESTDYSLLQEGDDIGHFDRYGGRGYHETSPKRAEDIKKEGLGHHPGLSLPGGGGIEGHETNLWMCAWADPSLAARLLARGREGDWRWEVADRIADDLSKHLVQKFPDLKVVWFYKDAKGKGLSKYSGAKCSFDLREVVEWLATNAEDGPYLYGDEYMGYCLSWRGPRIPPSFLRWEQQNPRAHRAAPVPKRANGLLASLALVGIGMVAGVYVEEQKGVAARVRRALKGKDKVAREQFDRLKRDVLAAKPRAGGAQERVPLTIRTSTPITVRSSIVEAVTDPAWVREESPDGKGYIHARTMKGTPYEVFERVYGKGNKLVVLDVGEAHERVNAPNGKDGWPSVAAAKRAAEALAGMRLASA